jgi:DNA helicase-2/ATP-dependent DNA helicase PcrA
LIELLIKENIHFIVHGANKIETSKIISDLLNIWSYCLGFEETELNEKSLFYNNKNEIIEKCKKIKNDLKLKKIKSNINFFYSLIHVSNFFKNTINNNNNSYLSDLSYLSKLIFELDLSLKKTDPLLVNSILKNAILKGELITDTEDKDAVNIMTIHQAKGLEFTATFLPHMVKKKNPNLIDEVLFDLYHYEIKDPNKVNDVDERRLRYVSFTRAKNWNFISRPTKLYTRNGHLRNFRPETILENLKLKTSSSEEIIKSIRQHKVVNESEKLKETKRQSISYSRLSTYILCPRKFNLQYNYGFATIRNTMLNIGSSSHRCLDNLHKNYLNSKKTKYLDSEIEKIVEDNWIELPGRRRESREYKKKLILNLKNYLNKYLWIFPNIFKSEHHFSFYNKLKNYELTGVVDLMLKNKKSLTIIDFKQSSIEQPEYKDQMILYYYVAQKVTEEIKEFKLWLFSVSDCKHKEIIIKKDDLEKFKTKINSVVQNIIDEKFSPNKGHHCKKCPYYEFCY